MVADALAGQGVQLRPSAGAPPPNSHPAFAPGTPPPSYNGCAPPPASYGYPAPAPAPSGYPVPSPAPPGYMVPPPAPPSYLPTPAHSQELAELKQQVTR